MSPLPAAPAPCGCPTFRIGTWRAEGLYVTGIETHHNPACPEAGLVELESSTRHRQEGRAG